MASKKTAAKKAPAKAKAQKDKAPAKTEVKPDKVRPLVEVSKPTGTLNLRAAEDQMKALQARFGVGALMRYSDKVDHSYEVFHSGSYDLDLALGCGGYPRGRVIEVFGPESSGKTTLCLHALVEAQRAYPNLFVAFVDAEHALDMKYALALGIDTKRLLVSQPDSGEQAVEIVRSLVASGICSAIVVDSVAALVPQDEIDSGMGDKTPGRHGRLMSQALRLLVASTAKHNVTVFFINQIRMKVGVLFGSPETTTGGNALKYYASIRLDVRRRERVDADGGKVAKDEAPAGNITHVKIVKNKCASPFKESSFTIQYGVGINKAHDLARFSVDKGLVENRGSHYYLDGTAVGRKWADYITALEEGASNAVRAMLEARALDLVRGGTGGDVHETPLEPEEGT